MNGQGEYQAVVELLLWLLMVWPLLKYWNGFWQLHLKEKSEKTKRVYGRLKRMIWNLGHMVYHERLETQFSKSEDGSSSQ